VVGGVKLNKLVLFLSLYLFFFLFLVNILFYSVYGLPVGEVDVDRYLYYLGDEDSRIVHDGFNPFRDWRYVFFYSFVSVFRNPRITLLWLPPLLLSVLVVLIYLFYSMIDRGTALFKSLVFVFLTYNVWGLFVCGLYRQLFAVVLFMAAVYLYFSKRFIVSCLMLLLAVWAHVNILPILFICLLAELIYRRMYWCVLAALLFSGVATYSLGLYAGVAYVSGAPQPSLYAVFFTFTNPLLWVYGLRGLKWGRADILLVLLLVTMPFTDQVRGLFFLHLVLVERSCRVFAGVKEKKYFVVLLLVLSYLWFNNLIIYLVKSMAFDFLDRGLDPSMLLRFLGVEKLLALK